MAGAVFDARGRYGLRIADTRAETLSFQVEVASLTGSSGDVAWKAGAPEKAVAVLPGQTLVEGVPSASIDDALPAGDVPAFPDGAGGTRPFVLAGETHSIRVAITHEFFNVVQGSGLPAGLTVTLASAEDPAAEVSTLSSFPGRAEGDVTVRSLRARIGATLVPTLENGGAIVPLASRPFTVRPGPAEELAVLLPGQTLRSGVPEIPGGAPDRAAFASGVPFGSGETPGGERISVRVMAVDRFGNPAPDAESPVLLVDRGATESGGTAAATSDTAAGSPVTIPGPFAAPDFTGGILVVVSDGTGSEEARVLAVDPGVSLTVDRLGRAFTTPSVAPLDLGSLEGKLAAVGQRFATLVSGAEASTDLPAGSTLTVLLDGDPALDTPVDLSGLSGGPAIAAGLEGQVRAAAQGTSSGPASSRGSRTPPAGTSS